MKRTYAAIGTIALLTLIAGRAEAFRMEPGLWRFTTMTNMSFSREVKTETKTQCISPNTADDVLKELTDTACKIEDRNETTDQLKWKMECRERPSDPAMRGTAEITTHGDTLDGTMDMRLEVEGHRMTFKTTWKGRRIGECE